MKRKIFALVTAFLFLFTACSNSTQSPQNESQSSSQTSSESNKKIVYTSFYPLYDFTSKIVKDKMDVRLIIPAGAEPHDYEVGAKTLAEMSEADLILLLGLEFEPWSEKLDDKTKEKIVLLGEKARPIEYDGHDEHDHEHHEGEEAHDEHDHEHHEEGEEHDHHHGFYDPHVWLDPTRAMDISKAILEKVIALDAENKDFYTQNHDEFLAQLSNLDAKLKEVASKYKGEHKDIVVSHNAFAYLTDTYDIHFESIAGLSPEAEPSLKRISEIIDEIREDQIKYIFFEELSNSKIIESISKETDSKIDILYTIEGMTDDEMKKGEDYLYKMNQNIEKIKLALE